MKLRVVVKVVHTTSGQKRENILRIDVFTSVETMVTVAKLRELSSRYVWQQIHRLWTGCASNPTVYVYRWSSVDDANSIGIREIFSFTITVHVIYKLELGSQIRMHSIAFDIRIARPFFVPSMK